MALFKHFRGTRASLNNQPLVDGYAYFCIDDGTFHIDYKDNNGVLQRKQINAKEAESIMGHDLDDFLFQDDIDAILTEAKESGKFDGADGVSVTHTWNGTRLVVTSASGTSSTDLKGPKGEDGKSGVYVGSGEMPDGYNIQIDPSGEASIPGGAGSADWSVNDPDAEGYIKNRTHWVELPFEPIHYDGNPNDRDQFDATVAGLGIFLKISEEPLTKEQLEMAKINLGLGGDFEYSYTVINDDIIGTIASYGSDILIASAKTAIDLTSTYGFAIPSKGIYICYAGLPILIDAILDILPAEETIHKLPEKYLPDVFWRNISSGGHLYPDYIILDVDGDTYYNNMYIGELSQEEREELKSIIISKHRGFLSIRFGGNSSVINLAFDLNFSESDTSRFIGQAVYDNVLVNLVYDIGTQQFEVSAKTIAVKSEIQTMINDALGVIENGTY